MAADVGRVVVAAADRDIVDVIRDSGGEAVMTDPYLPSGSDRIAQALDRVDDSRAHDGVLNLQGDLPTIDPGEIRAVLNPLADSKTDIATLAAEITRDDERANPNVVKAVISIFPGETVGRALYFTRATAPWGDGPHYHHIGIYAYRREALDRFVMLRPSPLEVREKLEQLRALEAGMRIAVALVDTIPLGVDTPAELDQARRMLTD